MKLHKGFFIVLLLVLIFLISGVQGIREIGPVSLPSFPDATRLSPSPAVLPDTSEMVTIVRVIDGDTIELEDGRKLRYIGVDTPETVDPRRSVQCFGNEASERNKELVLGKTVRLEKDVSETDSFGRLLRYVYLDTTMINELLVREGFARAISYPPDVKYQHILQNAEQKAREEKKGLWQGCENQSATFQLDVQHLLQHYLMNGF